MAGNGSVPRGAQTTPFESTFSAPSLAELAPHFPQLELLELLGQGGMGAVYKAKQTRLDRYVALKILPRLAGQEAEFANRFAREAQTMARLSHPNIVAIHDYGEAAGWFFFIMEYVDGVNLRQAIQAKSVQPKEALLIVGQVCEALQYAHDEGVVHRDIKPENILLDKRGRVKIADFGLAKLLGHSTQDRRLTRTHQVMGTMGYMAPEQMEGSKEVDHRADLFALGVVFYELLTGELPMGRFAPPSQKVQVDVRIDEVVLKTLEKEPQRRYQQASQIKQDVERISRGEEATLNRSKEAGQRPMRLKEMLPLLMNPTAAGLTLMVLGAMEFGLYFLSAFQMTEMHLNDSIAKKSWVLFTMTALFMGGAVAVSGVLIVWRRFWLLAVLGTVLAIVPLAPTASFLRIRNETTLSQLISLAERQGIKLNPDASELRRESSEARMLRDKILNLVDSSDAKIDQLIFVRWPTVLVTWLSIPAGIWTLVLLLRPGVRRTFQRRMRWEGVLSALWVIGCTLVLVMAADEKTARSGLLLQIGLFAFGPVLLYWTGRKILKNEEGLLIQSLYPKYVNSNMLALLLSGIGLLGCMMWVLIIHIQLAKSIQSIPASSSFSALDSWQGTIVVITLATTALYLLFQLGRAPRPSLGRAGSLLAVSALLMAMLLFFAYSIDASLPGMYVNLVNRKLGAAGVNFHLNVSDIMQLRHTPTEGLAVNWVAAIGLLLIGLWQLRQVIVAGQSAATSSPTLPAMPVEPNRQAGLPLGLGLVSFALIGVGTGLLVWVIASLYRHDTLITPFYSHNISAMEALGLAVITLLPGVICLAFLVRQLWGSQVESWVALVFRIMAVVVLAIGVMFTSWIGWHLANDEVVPTSLDPLIRYYGEAIGWGTGMITGGIIALIIGWWPIKLPQNKWYYWAIGVLLLLILIGAINYYLVLRTELVPIPTGST